MQIDMVEKLRSGKRSGESGFTTIEMFVAMILFAIVVSAIYGLLEVGRSARFNAMESNEATQDIRVGLNTMAKDVLNAGVDYPNVGTLVPNNWLNAHLSIPGSVNLTPVVPGYQLNTLVNTSVNPPVITKTDQVTFISTDNTFNGGVPLRLTAMNSANAYMTIDPAIVAPATTAEDNTGCNLGDLLFVNSASPGGTPGVVCLITGKTSGVRVNDTVIVASDPLGINDLSRGASGNMLPVGTPAGSLCGANRITMVTYHVVDDGSGQGTGTLVRTVYGGVDSGGSVIASSDQPLAFDITAMNIQYYLQDGTITTNPTAAQFQDIRQLTVTLTVKSPRKDPKTNQNYIDTLSSTFNTRNLGYEKN